MHSKTKPVDPTHYRKYDPAHRQLRAQWAARVEFGDELCARCGKLIRLRESWDLGLHAEGEQSDRPGERWKASGARLHLASNFE